MKRAIALACALTLGGLATYAMGTLTRPEAYAQEASALTHAYKAERALAVDQGLTLAGQGTTDESTLSQSVSLEPGECVALVAAIEGTVSVVASLRVGTIGPVESGDLVHVAACATEPGTASWSLSWAASPPFGHPQRVHYALFRGHVRSPRTYARLRYDERTRVSFDAAAVHARLEARIAPDARIGDVRIADREHAVLLPATRASFAALRGLTGRRDLVPDVAPDQAGADPFVTETDVHTAPRVFTATGRARVLAVVDVGALGSGCVALALVRADDPVVATPVQRISIPDLHTDTLAATDPAIVVDELCPAHGLFVYVAEESAGGTYEISASRVEAEAAAPTSPSQFGAATTGRHPSDGFVLLPLPFVEQTRASCAASEAASCFALAVLARDRIEGAGTVSEALDPLCSASGGAACEVLAGAIESSDPTRSRALERRACMTGVPDACLRHGARFLENASDLAAAYRTFRYGCRSACPGCCTAAAAMQQWQLAPPGASETPDEPG